MTPMLPPEHTLSTQLRKNIVDIIKLLPRIEYSRRSNGEIDFYGASAIIANQLKLEKPLYGLASWKHGWLWFDTISPVRLVESENKKIHNLVFTKKDEMYLKSYGYSKAVAVGAPFIYSEQKEISRIPNSILIFPPHSTQSCKFDASSDRLPYIDYLLSLKDKFSVVVASIGGEDVIKNNWIHAFEKANIPWITGAWSYDKNALNRINTLIHHFEFVTSNNPGSHFAYAAYCGCKVSFWGSDVERKKSDLTIHPFYKKNPHIAKVFNNIDFATEFKKRYPFFFVEPWAADQHIEWAKAVLGEDNKKQPEEIARLFGWNILQTMPGRWKPLDTSDYLTNEELFAKALAKSLTDRHEEALKITNVLKRRHVRMRDVEIIRARYFLNIGNTHGAREALKEELRHFPDNTQANKLFQELGGDSWNLHVAKNEDEKEFITFLNAVRPYTRLNIKRAKSLYDLAVKVCLNNVPGNFVECGVAAGGSTMLLALVVQKHSRIPRKVFAFDTFTGMPDPGEADTAKGVPADDTGWGTGTCAAPEEFVQTQCRRLGVSGIVETRKGLFDDTLPVHRAEIGEIALLHLDADWYSSTMTILDNLFEQLNDNALIQIDDYGAWDGCKKAILDYSIQHDLFFDVQQIDDTGVWCAKPSQTGNMLVGTPAHPRADVFLSPRLSPDFVDLYIVRKAILDRLDQAIPLFRGTLLDVGCGQMPYREYILKSQPLVKQYIGLDFAQGKYADLKQPDLTWDGATIPLDDASIDCAMATEVLEHCFNPSIVLQEIKRVLKPGGVFFFTVPFLWPIHDAPHDHYRYTPFALQKLLSDAGFQDIDIKALGGWNASLAQMIGLWLKRAPMSEQTRIQASKDLFPFYEQLIKADMPCEDFMTSSMATGFAGTARAKDNKTQMNDKIINSNKKNVLAIVCPQVGKPSETFITKHIQHLLPDKTVLLTGEVIDNKNINLKTKIIPIKIGNYVFNLEDQNSVLEFLINNSVTHILCEFGCIGAAVIDLNLKTLKLPIFVHFHGQDASEFIRNNDISEYYKWMGMVVNGIIAVSKPMAKRLKHVGIPEHKIKVIHYGVDYPEIIHAHPEQSPCRLLAVSRLVNKKGIFLTLRAFVKAKQYADNITLDIIGEGPLRKEIEEFITKNNCQNIVKLHGEQPHEYVLNMMDESSIFIQHSITDPETGNAEGLPLSILEASAHGLPVLATFHEGIPESVIHNQTGLLVEEKDWESMSAHIIILAKNPNLRKRMGMSGRIHIKDNGFTIEHSIKKLQNFIGLTNTPESNYKKNDVVTSNNNTNEFEVKYKNFQRILFINHNLYPFENSGTPISTLNHALGMNAQKVDVAVLIPSEDIKTGFKKQINESFTLYTLPQFEKDQVFLGEIDAEIMNEYLLSVQQIINDFSPDIVHINDYVYMPEAIISLFYKYNSTIIRNVCNMEEICHMDYPVIQSKHSCSLCSGPETALKCAECYIVNKIGINKNNISQDHLHEIEQKIQRRRDAVQKNYAEAIAGVIFTESSFKEYFLRYINISEENITIIPRGMSFEKNRLTSKKLANQNKVRFAFVGNIMPSKGIDIVLKSIPDLAKFDNFTLYIYGAIADISYKKIIQNLQLSYPDQFNYHGAFKKEDLPIISSQIDFAIVPSYFDTYNRTLRELLYYGVPVIVTDFHGASIIRNNVNGFKIPVGDSTALISTIKKILENFTVVDRITQGAFNTHIPLLSDEISKLLDFYNEKIMTKRSDRLSPSSKKRAARLIAFHLPQFHPIPENNSWWGQGFTEWTNVSKAKPLFPGHNQPRIPADLGFYDLRLPEARLAQADLAEKYGIEGFCYWHYWFHGKRLLERPVNDILTTGQPNFPFCLAWANETWSRRWLGEEKDILIKQTYSPEDDLNHISWLIKAFLDPRYIKINNRPVFLIYRPLDLPDPKRTTDLFRHECLRQGVHEPYLIGINSHCWKTDCKTLGFDTTLLFMPQLGNLPDYMDDSSSSSKLERNRQFGIENSKFKIYDYESSLNSMLDNRKKYEHSVIPSIFVGWDNTPRRGENSIIVVNNNPKTYHNALSSLVKEQSTKPSEERFIFINAWNEWAEGNYLEPDFLNGRAFLESTLAAVSPPKFTTPLNEDEALFKDLTKFDNTKNLNIADFLFYNKGDISSAKKLYLEHIENNKTDEESLLSLASIIAYHGNFKFADKLIDQAKIVNPQSIWPSWFKNKLHNPNWFVNQIQKLSKMIKSNVIHSKSFDTFDDDFWFWIHTMGQRKYPELQQFLPGLPEAEVQINLTGTSGDRSMLHGFQQFSIFKDLLLKYGKPSHLIKNILDYGCGYGRMIRFFIKDMPNARLHGVDISNRFYKWCSENFNYGIFSRCSAWPPTMYQDGLFDFIYSFSVFSHLSEKNSIAWLQELNRITSDDGLIVVTIWSHPSRTKSYHAAHFLDYNDLIQNYDTGHFCFSTLKYKSDSVYAEALIPPIYIHNTWSQYFKILEIIEGHPLSPSQSYVVMKKLAKGV